MALTFIKQNGKTLVFTLGAGAVPEITPVSADAPIALVCDGTEKYLLAAAHVSMPHVSGPVTLPRETAQLVAFNLNAIVAKYGDQALKTAAWKAQKKAAKTAAPKSAPFLANEEEPEEEDEEQDNDD